MFHPQLVHGISPVQEGVEEMRFPSFLLTTPTQLAPSCPGLRVGPGHEGVWRRERREIMGKIMGKKKGKKPFVFDFGGPEYGSARKALSEWELRAMGIDPRTVRCICTANLLVTIRPIGGRTYELIVR